MVNPFYRRQHQFVLWTDLHSHRYGMFGFAQVIEMVTNRAEFNFLGGEKLTIKGSLLNKDEVKGVLPNAARSGLLGCFVGILPAPVRPLPLSFAI